MEDIEYAKLNHKKRRGKPQQNRPHLEEPSTIIYADIKTSHIHLPVEDTKPNVIEKTLTKYGKIIKILIVIIIALSCSLVGLVSNAFLSHRSSCPENNSSTMCSSPAPTTQSVHPWDAEIRLMEIKKFCVNISGVPEGSRKGQAAVSSTLSRWLMLAISEAYQALGLHPPEGCSVCPAVWLPHRESCYYFSSGREHRTWSESREMCERMGADLLIIEDREEKEFIDRSSRGRAYPMFWIGAHRGGDGWRWVDGQSYNTGLSQLSGESSANCIWLQAGVGYYNEDCRSKHSWICEKRALKI